jgi:molecular chaperone GrpE
MSKVDKKKHKDEHMKEKCTCDDTCCNGSKECTCNNTSDCGQEKNNHVEKDNKELEEANKKIAELKETVLRTQADVQNYKRRKDEEMVKMLKYANEDLVKEFLPIIDNFERAIKMDDSDLSDEVSKFLTGFKIIYTNTLNLLEKFEVKEIQAEGVEFDPTYHHAVLTEHDDNKPEGVVLEVLQKGYMYKDKVIRPSMVKVNG